MQVKQQITGLVPDEQNLWILFGDHIGPNDRVFRTATGYIIIGPDDDPPADAEALGAVSEWFD